MDWNMSTSIFLVTHILVTPDWLDEMGRTSLNTVHLSNIHISLYWIFEQGWCLLSAGCNIKGKEEPVLQKADLEVDRFVEDSSDLYLPLCIFFFNAHLQLLTFSLALVSVFVQLIIVSMLTHQTDMVNINIRMIAC